MERRSLNGRRRKHEGDNPAIRVVLGLVEFADPDWTRPTRVDRRLRDEYHMPRRVREPCLIPTGERDPLPDVRVRPTRDLWMLTRLRRRARGHAVSFEPLD